MFEEYIEQNYQRIINQIEHFTNYKYILEILEDEHLEDCYKQYLSAEVNWWIYEEKLLWKNHPNFDYEHPSAKNILDELDKIYFSIAKFSFKDLKLALHNAIKVRLNYLCRPRTTLKHFIFRGEPTKPIQEILLRLDYFYDYEYLRQGVINSLQDIELTNGTNRLLSSVDFIRIVEKCDNEYILELSPEEFVGLLEPLFEFMNIGGEIAINKVIPVPAFIIFLSDKNIKHYPDLFYEMYEQKTLVQATKKDLVNAIINILEKYSVEEKTEETELSFTTSKEEKLEVAQKEEEILEPHYEAQEEIAEEVSNTESEFKPEEFSELVESVEVEKLEEEAESEIGVDVLTEESIIDQEAPKIEEDTYVAIEESLTETAPEKDTQLVIEKAKIEEKSKQEQTQEKTRTCKRGLICVFDVFAIGAEYVPIYDGFIHAINNYRNLQGYEIFAPNFKKEILDYEFLADKRISEKN